MSGLTLRNLNKSFGALQVIHGVDLDITPGEFVVFVGPSGSGKSTLLRMIAGLEDISQGDLVIGDQRMNDISPADRGIAMVFQSYALYPHMSVAKNMAFGLKIAGMKHTEIDRRVTETARLLEIEPLLDRQPKALSGGQRQRVAIGRAMVRDPEVFLFDEPLSNLDAALRVQTRIEIARLHKKVGATMIYVTHDQTEAMTLADRIVVLNQGRIEQVGTPIELYDSPANSFVAQFIGSPKMNMVPVTGTPNGVKLPGGNEVALAHLGARNAMQIGIRPEHLSLEGAGATVFELQVDIVEQLGELTMVYGQIDGSPITAKLPRHDQIHEGEKLTLHFDLATTHFFDGSGQRIPTTL